jgi:threonylcarbamoyladenosine tRNA methylthiotransferase MtaB
VNQKKNIRVAVQNFGCKVNQLEGLKLSAQFSVRGYQLCGHDENADVYVVNTCTVTHNADRTSDKAIRRTLRQNSNAVVVVTGCHAESWNDPSLPRNRVLKISQLKKENLVAEVEKTLFGGTSEILDTLDYHTISPLPMRTKAYLKIQDGCDRFCTFCIIPFIRGRSRSKSAEQVLQEAQDLIQKGHKEIVITGICVGDYGHDLTPKKSLSDLIMDLLSLSPHVRWRLSSIDPCDVDEKLVQTIWTHPNFCKHFHLALQHGSSRILKKMGRDYTKQEFFVLCRELRRRIPDAAITTDVMVGFPGETKEDFLETYAFVEATAFSKTHVFPYSERKGTGAAKHVGKVPHHIKKEREHMLLELSKALSIRFYASCLGSRQEVLIERSREQETGLLQGYTSNYIPVLMDGPDHLMGELVSVFLEAAAGDKVYGRCLNGFLVKSS